MARNPPLKEKDQLFDRTGPESDFRFDAATATVFDDMVSRSVPFYDEIQRMTCEIAADFAIEDSNLFDLGCSTGTTMIELDKYINKGTRFVGVDSSEEMLKKARVKLDNAKVTRAIDLVQADLHQSKVVENASVVIMILMLQFMRPLYRERVIKNIYDGMRKDSCIILVEKLTASDGLINRLFIKYYYEMKRRNGYSDLEISQKREALENVLIPYQWEENRDLLKWAGFRHIEIFFRWYNFCGIVALK
jgi:tRNA (cmo5U34)-methyltransferase